MHHLFSYSLRSTEHNLIYFLIHPVTLAPPSPTRINAHENIACVATIVVNKQVNIIICSNVISVYVISSGVLGINNITGDTPGYIQMNIL